MARGNNRTLPSNTGAILNTISGDLRASVLVLNPNDGVLYVVIDGQASPTTWDFVVPSQSYAALPGPWQSVGLWYVDQSGAGRSGNVTVYESDNRLDVPIYQAVGIARLAQVTSLDITEGTVPANPGAGIARLWADGTDKLHLLNPGGVDRQFLDTSWINALTSFFRITGQQSPPAAGMGLEAFFDGTNGILQAFDRGGAVFKPLYLEGSDIHLIPQGGSIFLPNSSILHDMIAPNAITTALSGAVGGFGASTTSASFVPLGSTFPHNVSSGSMYLLSIATISYQCSVAGAATSFYWGLDGGTTLGTFAPNPPVANYTQVITLAAFQATPTTGTHNFQLFGATTAGTLSVNGVQTFTLELRR